jgi:hypothetical protein
MAKKDKEETNEPFETVTVTEDANGNPLLPGAEFQVVSIKELNKAIKDVRLNLNPAFVLASNNLKQGQKAVKELADKHKEHFLYDEDEGTYTYDDGVVRLVIKEEEKLTYEILEDE